MTIQLHRLSYALGAEVIGVDLTRPLNDETAHKLNKAFIDHLVLLFRGQEITQDQQIALTRCFGEVETHQALHKHVTGTNEGAVRKKTDPGDHILLNKSPSYAAQVWHSDRSFTRIPT